MTTKKKEQSFKKWTKEDHEILKNLITQGKTIHYISHKLKRSLYSLVTQLKRLKIKYKNHQIRHLSALISVRINDCRRRSKKRKVPISINRRDIEELLIKQNGLCYYTGLKMTVAQKGLRSFSIDRKNSQKGYTKENIVLCCSIVNSMKNKLSQKLFYKYCKLVVGYHEKYSRNSN